jgi:hypothetical protein
MATITFRLPGREQYSYAEVSFDTNEPDYVQETVQAILKDALADLDAVYPETVRPAPVAAAPVAQPAPQAAPSDIPSCAHGPRTHRKGTSAKGQWQALFCSQPKGPTQCQAVWLKAGEPGWQW